MLRKLREARDEEGFTLIELLVVVIIIGILAAIAIPVFLNQRERAWEKAAESDLRNAAVELESYFADTNAYPADQAALDAMVGVEIQMSDNVVKTGTTTPGITYALATGGQAYCLAVAHLNIDDTGGTVVATYESNSGGLVDAGSLHDCSTF